MIVVLSNLYCSLLTFYPPFYVLFPPIRKLLIHHTRACADILIFRQFQCTSSWPRLKILNGDFNQTIKAIFSLLFFSSINLLHRSINFSNQRCGLIAALSSSFLYFWERKKNRLMMWNYDLRNWMYRTLLL